MIEMEVAHHFKASLVASSLLAAIWMESGIVELATVAAAGVAAGTLIDIDHFPVYRLKTGDWRHLRNAIKNPLKVTRDNVGVMMRIPPRDKYAAHAVSMPAVTCLTWFFYPEILPVVAGNLALHLGMDIAHSYTEGEILN